MQSGDAMSADEGQLRVFGEKTIFALEILHAPGMIRVSEPEDCKGSWGKWHLWVADVNLMQTPVENRRRTDGNR